MGERRLILIPQRPGSIEREGKRVGKTRSGFRSAPKLRESQFEIGVDTSVAPALASMIQGNVNDRVLHRLNMNVFESTDRLVGLARFEDPDHENQITRVRSEASHLTRGVLLMVVRALQHCVSIASLGVLASRLHIMLPVALII